MKKENAYFTVEAAMVFPVVMACILFVVYMMLYQYDRCMLEQDLGAAALWGSRVEASGGESLEELIQGRMNEINREKYAAWSLTALDAALDKNNFSVTGAGQIRFPLPGWNFWSSGNVWSAEADYRFGRLSPVTFVRLCRKVKDGISGTPDEGQESLSGENG